jgi:hypothetical protein
MSRFKFAAMYASVLGRAHATCKVILICNDSPSMPSLLFPSLPGKWLWTYSPDKMIRLSRLKLLVRFFYLTQ